LLVLGSNVLCGLQRLRYKTDFLPICRNLQQEPEDRLRFTAKKSC
jgi:hypothetical protein